MLDKSQLRAKATALLKDATAKLGGQDVAGGIAATRALVAFSSLLEKSRLTLPLAELAFRDSPSSHERFSLPFFGASSSACGRHGARHA